MSGGVGAGVDIRVQVWVRPVMVSAAWKWSVEFAPSAHGLQSAGGGLRALRRGLLASLSSHHVGASWFWGRYSSLAAQNGFRSWWPSCAPGCAEGPWPPAGPAEAPAGVGRVGTGSLPLASRFAKLRIAFVLPTASPCGLSLLNRSPPSPPMRVSVLPFKKCASRLLPGHRLGPEGPEGVPFRCCGRWALRTRPSHLRPSPRTWDTWSCCCHGPLPRTPPPFSKVPRLPTCSPEGQSFHPDDGLNQCLQPFGPRGPPGACRPGLATPV